MAPRKTSRACSRTWALPPTRTKPTPVVVRPLLTAVLLLSLFPGFAAAQETLSPAGGVEIADAWAYDRPDVLLVTDFSFFTGSRTINGFDTDYFATGIIVAGQVRVWEDLWVDAAWGFSHGSFSIPMDPFPIGGGGTRIGNPYLGASYVIDGGGVRGGFGLGFTIPLSEAPEWDPTDPTDLDDLAKSLADVLVAQASGNVNPWLYLSNAFSLVANGHIESVGPFLLAADLTVAPMFATSDTGVYSGDTELVLVPAGEVGWRPSPWLSLGMRGQVAVFPTETDQTLGSIEPFVQAEKRGVGHFRLGFVVHLGGPSGTTFDENGLWALRLTAGVLF
jgi:hypothetical protein